MIRERIGASPGARAGPAQLVLAMASWLVLAGCGDRRPNVLLITIDTLRADRLGSYGYALDSSPEIDAVAAEGVLFERAVAAASTTTPSHASIMTSRYTRQHSVGHFNNARTQLEGIPPLAEHFRRAGWATAAFVSNFLLGPRMGFNQGFDEFQSRLDSYPHGDKVIFESAANRTTRSALTWLEALEEGPFLIWVHYQDPHGPYTPPPDIAERFRGAPDPEEPRLPVLEVRFGKNGIPPYQRIEGMDRASEYERLYAGEIFFADRWIGGLLRAVEEHPSDRETIVLITSDHGESLGEDRIYFDHSHGTTPDLAWVPMILRAPGLPPERRSDLVSHVDVMPTLLELASLPVPPDARGLALGPFLREQRPLPDRIVYCDIGRELAADRRDGFARLLNVYPVLLDVDAIPESAGAAPPQDDAPAWLVYDWAVDGRWSRVEDEAKLAEEVRAYLREVTRPSFMDEPSPEDIERLRALGYW